MQQRIASCFLMGAGSAAIVVGVLLARGSSKRASVAHRRNRRVHTSMPEGWGVWFFQGFSDVALGVHQMRAVLVLGLCIALGIGLVSLGVRLGW